MKSVLVGYTGFVGSNIFKSYSFDAVYNSKNIKESFGSNPDLLVYAGLRAEKFIANKFPEQDLESIQEAMINIKKINPKTLVLISTIDVYQNTDGKTEENIECCQEMLPYGKNRLLLEEWVIKNFDNYLIIRLPGIYGINIKKNFIYDMIHYVPKLLSESKYNELSRKNLIISHYYFLQDTGFYKIKDITSEDKSILKKVFSDLSFSALNFTDSRGYFQFYNLKYLWNHINIALKNNIKILNLATEPIRISDLYYNIYHHEFNNEISENPPYYNFKTIYSNIFNGSNGYIFNKAFILKDIEEFLKSQREE